MEEYKLTEGGYIPTGNPLVTKEQLDEINASITPIPVSEDREVWVEVGDNEFADFIGDMDTLVVVGCRDGKGAPRWLKKVKLSSLVLNQSK